MMNEKERLIKNCYPEEDINLHGNHFHCRYWKLDEDGVSRFSNKPLEEK